MTRIVTASETSINEAAQILRGGGLVGMPTETVYGLAANAHDGEAIARIYEAKGRPSFNPLISHFAKLEDIERYAVIDERARNVARRFWPGPLTLILPRRDACAISELASAGLPTLAVRVPAHDVARKLIKAAGVPLVAPSANISGSLSPTTPAHVAQSLGNKVNIILAAGACEVGLESTVIDLSEAEPMILRPGAITAGELEHVLGERVLLETEASENPRSPGMLLKHYAPDTPVRLNAIDLKPGEALLAFGSIKFMGVRGGGSAQNLPENMYRNLSEEGDLNEAASNLFAMLKELDEGAARGIAIMAVPETGLGIAINDRLKRAAS